MDKAITAFHDYVVGDVLVHISGVTSRTMFGGYGLYLNGAIFAIITSDTELRFKVDDSNRAEYEAVGSTPLTYTGHKDNKPTVMQYWLVPEEVMEDREHIANWVEAAAAISRKKKK